MDIYIYIYIYGYIYGYIYIYIMDINLYQIHDLQLFSPILCCFFIFMMASLDVQKLFSLM